jgi:heme-degrading monooxygenase HmoA
MFSVLFEVQPKPDRWDTYLEYAKLLKPELERIEGFVDNIRYRSLTREGWLLSLSNWRDEKSLVRWRTQAKHHAVQEKGRTEVFLDYHLRVGQLTRDTRLPAGLNLREQRLDATEVGAGTCVTLLDAKRPPAAWGDAKPVEIAAGLGLLPSAAGLVAWDVFEAVLTPGEAIALMSWRDQTAAEAFERTAVMGKDVRLRQVRVVRDYGMFDRREAPQYYAAAERKTV